MTRFRANYLAGVGGNGPPAAHGRVVDSAPMRSCVVVSFESGPPVATVFPCRNQHAYLLTPTGR